MENTKRKFFFPDFLQEIEAETREEAEKILKKMTEKEQPQKTLDIKNESNG